MDAICIISHLLSLDPANFQTFTAPTFTCSSLKGEYRMESTQNKWTLNSYIAFSTKSICHNFWSIRKEIID